MGTEGVTPHVLLLFLPGRMRGSGLVVLGLGQAGNQRVTVCPGSGHWGGVRWCPEATGTAGVNGHGLLWVLVRYGAEGPRVNTAWVPVGGIFLAVVWVASGHGLIFRGKWLVQR